MSFNPRVFPHASFWRQNTSVENSGWGVGALISAYFLIQAFWLKGGGEERIQTRKRFKRTL